MEKKRNHHSIAGIVWILVWQIVARIAIMIAIIFVRIHVLVVVKRAVILVA